MENIVFFFFLCIGCGLRYFLFLRGLVVLVILMARSVNKRRRSLSLSLLWILPSSAELVQRNKVVKNVETISVFKRFSVEFGSRLDL